MPTRFDGSNFDEIDAYVEQLFGSSYTPHTGDIITFDHRLANINQIIQDAYNEAIWWHNNRISEGSDPKSGLRGLSYIEWDERIDGVAAMFGAASYSESSYERNGGSKYRAYQKERREAMIMLLHERKVEYVYCELGNESCWVHVSRLNERQLDSLMELSHRKGRLHPVEWLMILVTISFICWFVLRFSP
jgi:hypothetical protein